VEAEEARSAAQAELERKAAEEAARRVAEAEERWRLAAEAEEQDRRAVEAELEREARRRALEGGRAGHPELEIEPEPAVSVVSEPEADPGLPIYRWFDRT
jgi:dTMP kinase